MYNNNNNKNQQVTLPWVSGGHHITICTFLYLCVITEFILHTFNFKIDDSIWFWTSIFYNHFPNNFKSTYLAVVSLVLHSSCFHYAQAISFCFCFFAFQENGWTPCITVWAYNRISIFWKPSIWALCIPSASIFTHCLLWAWGLLWHCFVRN